MELLDALEGNLHVGTAEEVEADTDVGRLIVRDVYDLSGEHTKVEVAHPDLLSDNKVGGPELDIVVFLSEHALESQDLGIADNGPSRVLLLGGVTQERMNARQVAEEIEIDVGHSDEDNAWNDDRLHLTTLSAPPDMRLVARGDIAFDASVGQQSAYGFLGTWGYDGHVPTQGRRCHAVGRLDSCGCRRMIIGMKRFRFVHGFRDYLFCSFLSYVSSSSSSADSPLRQGW